MTMLKDPSLTRNRIVTMSKVRMFFDSIDRNSRDTRNSYNLGLAHFQNYLDSNHTSSNLNLESILQPLAKNEIDLYGLLDGFVSYLTSLKLSVKTMILFLSAVRSYLGYYDIDVIPARFKRRVKMPRLLREDEEPIDASDIRKILLACNNRRLKCYLLVLVSGGMRAKEAIAIRLKDIDFSVSPTKIRIRKEVAKTRVARDIYISDEATLYLQHGLIGNTGIKE
jgi:integrase